MALIDYTVYGKIDKVDLAITNLKMMAPVETGRCDKPYYVAYSGGKDSDVIRILCELAGVKHELWHNHTTADAPETVRYVRSIPGINISMPDTSMWQLIVKKKMPPTRLVRYCCSELKERGGQDRMVVTGVRRAESTNRTNRKFFESITPDIKKKTLFDAEQLTLNNDNAENREMVEQCIRQGKVVINPIIDWTDEDVWEFLNHYGCKSNPLYECGFNRVGCIGCPMASKKRYFEFERYPKYKTLYINAFQRMIDANPDLYDWKSGEKCFAWWMGEIKPSIKNQLTFADIFEDLRWEYDL